MNMAFGAEEQTFGISMPLNLEAALQESRISSSIGQKCSSILTHLPRDMHR